MPARAPSRTDRGLTVFVMGGGILDGNGFAVQTFAHTRQTRYIETMLF